MANVCFTIRKDANNANAPALIYVRMNLPNGKRFVKSTGWKIEPKFWSKKKHYPIPSTPKYYELDKMLMGLLDMIEKAYLTVKSKTTPTPSLIARELNELNGSLTPSLLKFIEGFIKKCEEGVIDRSQGTINNYITCKGHLEKFNRNLTFDEIDKNFYREFVSHLRKQKNYKGEFFSDNTVGHNIKTLKLFLTEALQAGLHKNLNHKLKYFETIKSSKDAIFLTEFELTKMLNLELYGQLEIERDRFIIRSYLGTRFSDSDFKKEQIFYKDDKYFFRYEQKKTEDNAVIPIKSFILDIFKKYDFRMPPQSANQVQNRNLKVIAAKAEIFDKIIIHETRGGKRVESVIQKNLLVTTHTARRSFATNALLAGVDRSRVKEAGGWKSDSSFERYIKITKQMNANLLSEHDFFK